MPRLQLGDYEYFNDPDQGIYPRFSTTIRRRVNAKRATNLTVCGEAGIGKTYTSNDICRGLNPKFTLEQVVFRYREFLMAIIYTAMGIPIVFDEPSYQMGKREWHKELNQALVKTIESFRFKVHPLFIPVINNSLIDKTIRGYLLQFTILCHDRGLASVYRLSPSAFQDKTYRYFYCTLRYPLFDRHLCNKDSCLDCDYLINEDEPEQECQVFRAGYERKKEKTQEQRYEQQLAEAESKEYSELTVQHIVDELMPLIDKTLNDKGRIAIPKLKLVLLKELGIRIGHNKSYDIRALIEYDHPEYAPIIKKPDASE
jgi:Cdc6-like AAA superfamily ATPase